MMLASLLLALQAGAPSNEATFALDNLTIRVADGHIRSLAAPDGSDYLAPQQSAPLLSVWVAGRAIAPEGMRWDPSKRSARLTFPGGIAADVRIEAKRTHLTCEVLGVRPKASVEAVLWGPYPTTIDETIGETVGVVRDSRFAIGIQALNAKTLGGHPRSVDDVEPSSSVFARSDYSDLPPEARERELYRGDTAQGTGFGSVLQAYTRDRSRARVIENWGHRRFVAPAFQDGGVVGSKIALFGCPAGSALQRIGDIEVAEGLPHPMLDGEWAKTADGASASYLIVDFGENSLDQALELTHKAGLAYLYTDGCFKTWGHFQLDEGRFPDGWASLKRCVERAGAQGVRLGVHTLSNFITTNDPYVTPVPDPRLAAVGSAALVEPIDAKATELTVDDADAFDPTANNALRTARIGKELIRYESVSSEAPWRLLGCERGAFGTGPSAHPRGAKVDKLADHAYKVFLSDAALSKEIARTIARLFNETGLRQLSFDGIEGTFVAGMGQYARALFAQAWYDALRPGLQGQVVNDASNPGHFFWHIYTRMNWGEPWYAGFRESQTEYRLANQRYFRRNLMPGMLGWFSMSTGTSLEDAEWLLARAAGFDAGFCLITNPAIVAQNGDGEAILAAVREWESARHAGAFTPDQKRRMERVENEFRLKPVGEGAWDLVQVASTKVKLPMAGALKLELSNPYAAQPVEAIMQVPEGTRAEGIEILLDGGRRVGVAGVFDGPCRIRWIEGVATRQDASLRPTGTAPVEGAPLLVEPGRHTLEMKAKVAGAKPAGLHVELRLYGPAERVVAGKGSAR